MPQRIGRVVIHNKTRHLRLVKTFDHLCGGEWTPGGWRPPAAIEPGATGGMQSESNGFMTGTEGYAKYDVVWGVRRLGMIYVYWNNPWYGVTRPRFASHASDVRPDCDYQTPSDASTFSVDTSLDFHLVPTSYRHTKGGGDITAPGDLLHAFTAGPVGGIAALFGLAGIVKDPAWEYELRDGRFSFRSGQPTPALDTRGHAVYGAILDKWAALGYANGPLGYPVMSESGLPDGVGRYVNFEHGAIYWHPNPHVGAHAVWGAIGARWHRIGKEKFGYPITDELTTPDGVGRYNHFRTFAAGGRTYDASIYWTPTTGAHEVYGGIREKWAAMGWERSSLGYPLSAEADFEGGRLQRFQSGALFWTPHGGVVVR